MEGAERDGTVASADETKSAGRGLISITGAKAYFIITSYAIQIALPRLLTTHEFGLFSSAMNVAAMVNNVLIVSTVQSVSKFVSESDDGSGAALRRGLGIQIGLGTLLGSMFFFGAPAIADSMLDDALTPLVRFSSGVVFSYALYAAFVGYLNGRRVFHRQALLDMTFSTLRAAGILGAAALGFGAAGAMGGFATAAFLIMLSAAAFVGFGAPTTAGTVTVKRWLAFTTPLWLYHAFLNGIMQIDVAVLKRLAAEMALAAGSTAEAAANEASELVAFYRAAQMFAFVPYQLILSLTFIIFPLVSKAIAERNEAATKRYVQAAMRFSILFLVSIAAPISGAASSVMKLAYPAEYAAGGSVLAVLSIGMVFFALFVIAATIITSAGRPGAAAVIGAISLVVVVVGNVVLVRQAGLGTAALGAAAMGTTLGTFVAVVLSGAFVYRMTNAFVPPLTVLRSVICGVGAFYAASYVATLGTSKLAAIGALAAGFFTFVIGAAVTREFGKDEIGLVRRVLKI